MKIPAPHQCVQKVCPEAEGTLYLVPAGTSAGYIRRYSPASVNVFGGNVPGQPRPLVLFGEIVVVLTPNNCFGAVKESLGAPPRNLRGGYDGVGKNVHLKLAIKEPRF